MKVKTYHNPIRQIHQSNLGGHYKLETEEYIHWRSYIETNQNLYSYYPTLMKCRLLK